jgi:hypothetical protein
VQRHARGEKGFVVGVCVHADEGGGVDHQERLRGDSRFTTATKGSR